MSLSPSPATNSAPASTPPELTPPSISLIRLIMEHRALVIGCFLATFITIAINIALPFVIKHILDAYQEGTIEGVQTALLLGMYGVAALIAAAGSYYMRRMPQNLGQRINSQVRRLCLRNLFTLDRSFFGKQSTGDMMNRLNSDIGAVGEMVTNTCLNGFRGVLVFLLAFAVMFRENLQLGLVMAGLIFGMMFIGFLLVRLLRRHWERSQEKFSEISHFCQENFSGIRLVKGFGIESRQEELFAEHNRGYLKTNMSLAKRESAVWPFMDFIFLFGNLLIIWLGGRMVIEGTLSLGTLALFQQYLLYLQWPTLAMGWTFGQYIKGRASWERVKLMLETKPVVRDSLDSATSTEEIQPGEIEFEGVGVELGGVWVLRDISLRIPQGATVGITGPTGCGKSTLASLLLRELDPSEGRITIGGRDIRTYPLHALRNHIRIAPQDPFLFSDTLRNNIAFGADEKGEQPVEWASDVAHLTSDVTQFEEGLNTLLGERGVTLSGGQRQRASIARAVVGSPPVLVLDDTLSAVDTQTEKKILDQLLPILKNRTALVISHRITTLRHADLIVVMKQGGIETMGTHAELVAAPGPYRELDTIQRLEARLETL